MPGNWFAAVSLRQLATLVQALFGDQAFAAECTALADEVEAAPDRYGVLHGAHDANAWAYEVNGYGDQVCMDDANVSSLLGLPCLGCVPRGDARYRATRRLVWSGRNPYFFRGSAGEGIGGPHEGLGMIWPMPIMLRALAGDDPREIGQCLEWLAATDAGTGFMHEAFNRDDPAHFTRAWFAWANSLFGELIIDVSERHPALLQAAGGPAAPVRAERPRGQA